MEAAGLPPRYLPDAHGAMRLNLSFQLVSTRNAFPIGQILRPAPFASLPLGSRVVGSYRCAVGLWGVSLSISPPFTVRLADAGAGLVSFIIRALAAGQRFMRGVFRLELRGI